MQSVTFRASPRELFDLYMDSKKHSNVTGARASLSKKIGSNFTAYDGFIKGKTLHFADSRMIVQTWRGSDWKASDPDSVLIISIDNAGRGQSKLTMVHANVPSNQFEHLKKGWMDFYWKPWKQQLAIASGAKKKKQPAMRKRTSARAKSSTRRN